MKKINKSNSDSLDGLFDNLKKVVSGTSISRVFGLIRDISTTNLLGATIFHDIFVICLKIPNLFREFFAEGAFNQAFVPIYGDYEKKQKEKETKEFLNSLAGILLSILSIFTIIVLVFTPIFIFIFAPGYYFDPIKKDLSTDILRIMFPYLALISLVAFAGGIQNTHKKFFIPAFTPVIFNISLIIAALAIAPKYEIPIYALAWGVFVAGVIQLLLQIIPIMNLNRFPIPKINLDNPGLKKFFKLILPAILAGGIAQINSLINTIIASLLETGSPTWLYVSDRLIQLPMGIFAIAIGTVLLPTLSKYDLSYEKEKFIETLHKGQRFILFLSLPSLIGLFFCAEDIISTIFYRGAFTDIDVYKSSYSLMAFSFGLPFFMMMKILTPAFFSRMDTKTPMYVALFSLFLNASLNYYLALILGYGHVGIAVGTSLSTLISVIVLEVILFKEGFIKVTNIFNNFNLNLVISSSLMILFLYFFTSHTNFVQMPQFQRVLFLFIEVSIAATIYLSVFRIIHKKQLKFLFN